MENFYISPDYICELENYLSDKSPERNMVIKFDFSTRTEFIFIPTITLSIFKFATLIKDSFYRINLKL